MKNLFYLFSCLRQFQLRLPIVILPIRAPHLLCLAFFFVHASADAPNFDVFASGSVVAYNFPYKADTGYFIVNPQTFEFKVAPTGTNKLCAHQYCSTFGRYLL